MKIKSNTLRMTEETDVKYLGLWGRYWSAKLTISGATLLLEFIMWDNKHSPFLMSVKLEHSVICRWMHSWWYITTCRVKCKLLTQIYMTSVTWLLPAFSTVQCYLLPILHEGIYFVCLFLYPQHLEQCLTHSSCSINICWMSKWVE